MKLLVEGVCKSYDGHAVLRGASFAADAGQIVCFMAPSGGGKTTLLRILMGLERPDAGSVKFTDLDANSAPERFPLTFRGNITTAERVRWSAAFQEDRLLLGRDAHSNLRFALGRAYDERKASELLEALGLGGVGTRPAREYSGGMRRRLALIRALLAPSDALALDEPLTGTDPEIRRRCLDAIRTYSAGRIALLATHELSDAITLDAKIIRLS